MENHITSKCVWYEVCGVFEREWTDDVPLSFFNRIADSMSVLFWEKRKIENQRVMW